MRQTTQQLLVIVTAIMVLWNIIAYWIGGRTATISEVISDFACEQPIMACAVGIVIGHWFWR